MRYRQKAQEIRDRHARRGIAVAVELDAYLDGITRGKMFHNHSYKRVFAPAPGHALPMDFTPEYSTLPEAIAALARRLQPKIDFLADRLGADFTAETR